MMNALRFAPLLVGATGFLFASSAQAAYQSIVVDTTADTFDPDGCIDRDPGNCSLRSAVHQANQTPEWDEIVLPTGTYVIDNPVEGVIDVSAPIHFKGDGPNASTVEFHLPGVVGIQATGANTYLVFASMALEGAAPDAGAVYGDHIQYLYLYDAAVRDFDYQSMIVGIEGGSLLLQEFDATDNVSDDFGSMAIYGEAEPGPNSYVWAEDLFISDNHGADGGSIVHVDYAEKWFDRAEIAHNDAGRAIVEFHGGGLGFESPKIYNLYFHHNSSHAGLRFIDPHAGGYLQKSAFTHNSMAFGTIKVENDLLSISHSTFAFNNAMTGSAISAVDGGRVFAFDLTVTDNPAIFGTFHAEPGSEINMQADAVEPSLGSDICAGGGTFVSYGANAFVGDATCPGHATDILTNDLMLQPLDQYGGFSPSRLPMPGSPLIDASTFWWGNEDQRGFPRETPFDVGAVECQPGEC
ncbi:MAG: CSLREA domain-containing protein [Myxococcota bacterium]